MEQDMTKGSPFRVLIMFTLPLAIGNIFQQLYNMADTIIVGRFVGADALAAVWLHRNDYVFAQWLCQGITAGFSVLTAQRFGAGKKGCSKTKRYQWYFIIHYRSHFTYSFRLRYYGSAAASDEHSR